MAQEMVIFTRVYELVSWLVPQTNHFPRSVRHSFTQRLLDAAFDLTEYLTEANARSGRSRLERLRLADEALVKLKLYIRLAFRWKWLSEGQYHHILKMEVEIGKLLGGWIKVTQ